MTLLLSPMFSADVSTTVCTATVRGRWTTCASATWGGPTRGATRAASATTTAPAPRGWGGGNGGGDGECKCYSKLFVTVNLSQAVWSSIYNSILSGRGRLHVHVFVCICRKTISHAKYHLAVGEPLSSIEEAAAEVLKNVNIITLRRPTV